MVLGVCPQLLYNERITRAGNVIGVRESMINLLELRRNKNFKCYHFRLGIETKFDVR